MIISEITTSNTCQQFKYKISKHIRLLENNINSRKLKNARDYYIQLKSDTKFSMCLLSGHLPEYDKFKALIEM